eukprot:9496645-Pyramimonas_sp.AAC.1
MLRYAKRLEQTASTPNKRAVQNGPCPANRCDQRFRFGSDAALRLTGLGFFRAGGGGGQAGGGGGGEAGAAGPVDARLPRLCAAALAVGPCARGGGGGGGGGGGPPRRVGGRRTRPPARPRPQVRAQRIRAAHPVCLLVCAPVYVFRRFVTSVTGKVVRLDVWKR